MASVVVVGTRFEIRGLEPIDFVWDVAGPAVKREFWRFVAATAVAVKDAELAAGLDRFGDDLAEISERTRRHRRSEVSEFADPDAPPLQPAHGASRTRSLLRVRKQGNVLVMYWARDPVRGGPWGRILGFHREGRGRYGRIPKRDVIGMGPKALARLERAAAEWWARQLAGLPAPAVPIREPDPATVPIRPRPVPVPKRPFTPRRRVFGEAEVSAVGMTGTAPGFRSFSGFFQFRR